MLRSTIFSLAALPAALAQSSSSTASAPASTSSGVHVVKVGDGGLTFSPNEITAAVGHTVEFHFYPEAHSVAQASFADPCQPLNDTAFFSGPIKVSSGVSSTVWSLTIEDDTPKWFYCATGKHCQNGMVGVINAPTTGTKTLKNFAAAAAKVSSNVAPSSTTGGTFSTAGSSSSSTSTPTPSSGSSSAGTKVAGELRWGLLSFGAAMAGLVGGFML